MKITIIVIAITVLIFGLQMAGVVNQDLAFMPATALSKPYTIVTSIFMHSGLNHLLLNMFGLFVFGSIVENEISWKKWLLLYFSAGFLGNLGYMLFTSSPFIPAIGASGAIFGLMGAAAAFKPKQIIYTQFGPVPMIAAAIIWGVTEFLYSFGSDNIAHSAHIAGLIGGVFFVYAYKKNLNPKILPIFLIIPIILTFGFATSIQKEIAGFKPELNDCYRLNQSAEEIDFKAYIYSCDNNTISSVSYPSTSKVDSAYYNQAFPTRTKQLYSSIFGSDCNTLTISEVNIKDGVFYTYGNICDYKFYDIAKNCGKVRVEVIQIYNSEPETKSIAC